MFVRASSIALTSAWCPRRVDGGFGRSVAGDFHVRRHPGDDSITSELSSNLPVILGVIGALIALSLAIRAIRKFVKV